MIQTLLCAFAITATFTTPRAVAQDWQVLFDGTSLQQWRAFKDNAQFELVDGAIVGSSSDQTHFLVTTREYADFELELEVKLHDPDLNSGVQIRTRTTRKNDKGDPREVVHGPQVDLGKSPGRSGYLYGQGNKGWITPKEELVRSDAMKNGHWNQIRVLAVGRKIQTWVNGMQMSDLTVDNDIHQRYRKGVIALQVHGVKKSPERVRQVSFRNIRVREFKP